MDRQANLSVEDWVKARDAADYAKNKVDELDRRSAAQTAQILERVRWLFYGVLILGVLTISDGKIGDVLKLLIK